MVHEIWSVTDLNENEKNCWRYHYLIHVYQKQKSGRIYSHLGPFFCAFTP